MKNTLVMCFIGGVIGHALTNVYYGIMLRKNWKELSKVNKQIEFLEADINKRIREAAATQQDIDKLLLELEKENS